MEAYYCSHPGYVPQSRLDEAEVEITRLQARIRELEDYLGVFPEPELIEGPEYDAEEARDC